MTISKLLKITAYTAVIISAAEIYRFLTTLLQKKLYLTDDDEFTVIFYTRSQKISENSRLTRNMTFTQDPVERATEILVNLIKSAKTSIFVAVYIFTSNSLAQALVKAHSEGVKVLVVVDGSMETASSSKIEILKKAGIPVKLDDSKMMHLKLCLIDVQTRNGIRTKSGASTRKTTPVDLPKSGIIITGSLNWTREALLSNEENFIVSANTNLCEKSAEKFKEIWEASRNA